jgi:hypothetical protein
MSNATLTLNGLYQYGLLANKDLFEKLSFPEGIDKQLAIDNILHNCADYEVLYPDFDFFSNALEFFSKKHLRTFEKWLAVMNIDYEPLDNYDRKEAWSDSTSQSTSESSYASESSSTSTSDSTSESSSTMGDISAFNATTLQPNESSALTASTAGQGTSTSGSESKDRNTGVLSRLDSHRGRVHGNIGVKTTQSIFMEEWELDKLNIYDEIMVIFAREFLIPFTY